MAIFNKLKQFVINGEPLSPETESRRKALLFTSSISILIAVYGLKVTKTPWLEVEVPLDAPNILHGGLAVALLYTFLMFLFSVSGDLKRRYFSADLLDLQKYFDSQRRLRASVDRVRLGLAGLESSRAPNARTIHDLIDLASEFNDFFDREIRGLRQAYWRLSTIMVARLVLLEIGTPLALGFFALWKIGGAIFPFLSVVFSGSAAGH